MDILQEFLGIVYLVTDATGKLLLRFGGLGVSPDVLPQAGLQAHHNSNGPHVWIMMLILTDLTTDVFHNSRLPGGSWWMRTPPSILSPVKIDIESIIYL